MPNDDTFSSTLPLLLGAGSGLLGVNTGPLQFMLQQRRLKEQNAALQAYRQQAGQFDAASLGLRQQTEAQRQAAQVNAGQALGYPNPEELGGLDASTLNLLLGPYLQKANLPDISASEVMADPTLAAYAQQLGNAQLVPPAQGLTELLNPPTLEQSVGEAPFGRGPGGELLYQRTDLGPFGVERRDEFMNLQPGERLTDTAGSQATVTAPAQPITLPLETAGPPLATVDEHALNVIRADYARLQDPTVDAAEKAKILANMGAGLRPEQQILAGLATPSKAGSRAGTNTQQLLTQTLFSPAGGSLWDDPRVVPYQAVLAQQYAAGNGVMDLFNLPPPLIDLVRQAEVKQQTQEKLLEGMGPGLQQSVKEFTTNITQLDKLVSVINEYAIVAKQVQAPGGGFKNRAGQVVKIITKSVAQSDTDLEYFRALGINMVAFARGVFGEKGPISDTDITRLLVGFPDEFDVQTTTHEKLTQLAQRIQTGKDVFAAKLVDQATFTEQLAQGVPISQIVEELTSRQMQNIDMEAIDALADKKRSVISQREATKYRWQRRRGVENYLPGGP